MVESVSIDYKLIKLLQINGKVSNKELAAELKLSPATIRRRIRILIKNRVIQTRTIIDPVKIGLPLSAIIALKVDPLELESIMDKLASHPMITWVGTITGRYDILISARFESNNKISAFLQKEIGHIEGIRDSETFIVLETRRKYHYATL